MEIGEATEGLLEDELFGLNDSPKQTSNKGQNNKKIKPNGKKAVDNDDIFNDFLGLDLVKQESNDQFGRMEDGFRDVLATAMSDEEDPVIEIGNKHKDQKKKYKKKQNQESKGSEKLDQFYENKNKNKVGNRRSRKSKKSQLSEDANGDV